MSVVFETYNENPRNLGVKPFLGPTILNIEKNKIFVSYAAQIKRSCTIGAYFRPLLQADFHTSKLL